jgi:integrase
MRAKDADIHLKKRIGFECRKEPYYRTIAPKMQLGYRRRLDAAGTWVVRRWHGDKHPDVRVLRGPDGRVVVADDFAEANELTVLSYGQALARAHEIAASDDLTIRSAHITVADALTHYENDLKARGGDMRNVTRVSRYLRKGHRDENGQLDEMVLLTLQVSRLDATAFDEWNKALTDAGIMPATRNRINFAFKAALNLAKTRDKRIKETPWRVALQKLPPTGSEPMNVILDEGDVAAIMRAAYADSNEFGLFVELCGQTGARPSQIGGRLQKRHLKVAASCGVMMPVSDKGGRGEKAVKSAWVPIPLDLALRLQQHAKGKRATDLLVAQPSGNPWCVKGGSGGWNKYYGDAFERALARCASNLKPRDDGLPVTLYALRHTHIARQLMDNVDATIVAKAHDTSTKMIENHYAAYINRPSDGLLRRTLIDLSASKVVQLAK